MFKIPKKIKLGNKIIINDLISFNENISLNINNLNDIDINNIEKHIENFKLIKNKTKYIKNMFFDLGIYLISYLDEVYNINNIEKKIKLLKIITNCLDINYNKNIYDEKEIINDGENPILFEKLIALKYRSIYILVSVIINNICIKNKNITNKNKYIINDLEKESIELRNDIFKVLDNRYNYDSEKLIFIFYTFMYKNDFSDFKDNFLQNFTSYINDNEKFGKNYSNYGEYGINLIEILEFFINNNDLNKNNKNNENILNKYKYIFNNFQQSYGSREFYLLSLLKDFYLNFK